MIIQLLRADYDNWQVSSKNNQSLFEAIAKKSGHSLKKIKQVAKQMRRTHFKRRVPVQVSREKLGLLPVKMIRL